ncbi:serine hydrolase [Emticicia sp. BO119]|uniref:serine hydrolase n=1 Tax=Emticicia sp. BO119 TaxID=2757768 RepID=UPI0015F06FA8|nr:serine hydrolase [Emticicia sp. BO119]MBA4853733.1 serine hydrolase [Emticicia sp. BO119]
MKNIYLFLFLFIFSPALAQKKKSKTVVPVDSLKELDTFVNKMLEEWGVPGTALCIVKDGKLLYAKGYGVKDIKTKAPVTANTLFGIASCSKSFTSACLAILADEGKLDWNKPVKEYMPDFQLYDEYATRTLTARDLVSHRSGLPRHDYLWVSSPLNRKEMFDRLRYLPLNKPVYAQYQYNNLMYMVAGVLIERLSGKTWEEFMKEKILDPIGMKTTVLTYPEMLKNTDYSLSYSDEKNPEKEAGFDSNVDGIGPAGAVKANVTEMSNWLLLQLNKGKTGDKVIVSEKNLNENHTPLAVVQPAEAKYPELGFGTYGMGWTINTYRGHLRRQHGGSIEGYRSQMTVFPNDNLAVFITTNTGIVGYNFVTTITNYIADTYLEKNAIDWNSRLRKDFAEAKEKSAKIKIDNENQRQKDTKPTHTLGNYTGIYEHPAYGALTIGVDGNSLKADFHTEKFSLRHYHYDIFEGVGDWENIKFKFLMNAKGDIDRVSLEMPAAAMDIEMKKK